jgi:hypothetical protein
MVFCSRGGAGCINIPIIKGDFEMKTKIKTTIMTLFLISMLSMVFVTPVAAFHTGGQILINRHGFLWTDPASGGQVVIIEEVFEGCFNEAGEFIPHDMEWRYTVTNLGYDPNPPYTNGFSGFQLLFPGPVPELYNQQSPAVGGPWHQNAFSGQFPPFGVEWDAPLPGVGIMPGQTGVFSFCTFERVDVVVTAPDAGWAHTWGLAVPEPIIDADGTVSSGDGVPGAVEVAVLDPLASWPTGFDAEGIDWFDTDHNGLWTIGDDIHVEGAAYPTAFRDGLHDSNPDYQDPTVLDLDGSLVDGQPVDVDLETGTIDPWNAGFPHNTSQMDPRIKWYDTDGGGNWTDGEDIVLDLNNNGIFGEVLNIQTYIFYGNNSVPGALLFELGMASSDGHEINKKVKYMDADGDGIIEVGEVVNFLIVIQVHNPSGQTGTNVTVKDRFGAEIDITSAIPSVGTATLTTKGKSAKEFIEWNIGTLGPGGTANLVLKGNTDMNPAGKQEYTSPGVYEFNSGAVLKLRDSRGKQHSFETGGIYVTVLPAD